MSRMWIAVIAALALASSARAAAFDAWAHRQALGAIAFADARDKARREVAAAPAEIARADRLARLVLAGASTSSDDYRARAARLDKALADLRTQLAVMKTGPYPADWMQDRWLQDRAQATDPLARALFARVFVDQKQFHLGADGDDAEAEAFNLVLAAEQERNLAANTHWLKRVLVRIGWFDISRYDPEASQGAWLLVQHADRDPAWQRAVLAALAPRVKRGDMQGKYYAYLADRVAVNAGQAQVYGTQGGCHGPGATWRQKPVADPEGLEARRAELGLEPSADYMAKFTCR
ncbi:DUF6624 domain-containing protein [Caulobacter sp. LARHSG274]